MVPLKNLIIVLLLFLISCATVVQEKTTIRVDERGKHIKEEKIINGLVIENLEEIWENEFITANGQIPVLKKYEDDARNVALARRGAILDAQRNLAEKVNSISITEKVTLSDFSTSDFAQSTLNAELHNVEVVSEYYDEEKQLYNVKVQMPRAPLIIILKQYLK